MDEKKSPRSPLLVTGQAHGSPAGSPAGSPRAFPLFRVPVFDEDEQEGKDAVEPSQEEQELRLDSSPLLNEKEQENPMARPNPASPPPPPPLASSIRPMSLQDVIDAFSGQPPVGQEDEYQDMFEQALYTVYTETNNPEERQMAEKWLGPSRLLKREAEDATVEDQPILKKQRMGGTGADWFDYWIFTRARK
jgi:hypothetical protein